MSEVHGEKKVQVRKEVVSVTVQEVIRAWGVFPKPGKLSFLLTSEYMRQEFPSEDDAFFEAPDRLPCLDFADLPGDLQDEFRRFMDTPRYEIWIRKGGGNGGQGADAVGRHVESEG